MNKLIRILIADDHTIVRSGVRMLLQAEPDIDVVGEALNGCQAVAMVETLQPDVVLMDVSMPELDGLDATKIIKERWPHINILMLTMHRTDDYFFATLKVGASGYVIKGAETDELIHAVRVVSKGEVFLHPTMASKLVQGYLKQEENKAHHLLSPRELEILQLLAQGYSNKEIAEKLVISVSTVYTHRGSLMQKLGLHRRHDLIEYARKNGLLGNYSPL